MLPVIAVGLWGFVSLVIGTIVPAVYQQFFVQPNELAKEKPYIAAQHHRDRAAFGLDDKHVRADDVRLQEQPHRQGSPGRQPDDLDNARLWDPTVIASNYQIFQSLQTYYQFADADTDRYVIDGKLRQVLIAARELNSDDLPSPELGEPPPRLHARLRLGRVAEQRGRRRRPAELLPQRHPARGRPIPLLDRPEVYFGENLDGYSLVGAKQPEFNYPRAGRDHDVTPVQGRRDGVELSSLAAPGRVRAAVRRPNLLISGQITTRTPRSCSAATSRDRVKAAAPFLHFDEDPYPVIADGRLVWIFDGYTTSDNYPYSQSQTPDEGGASARASTTSATR